MDTKGRCQCSPSCDTFIQFAGSQGLSIPDLPCHCLIQNSNLTAHARIWKCQWQTFPQPPGKFLDAAFVNAVSAESYPGGRVALMRTTDSVIRFSWAYKYLADLDGNE